MPDHKAIKVVLTARVGRIRRDKGLSRLNLVESDSCGVATLTGTVEEGMGAQGQEELHQVQAGAEQNGELPTSPVETPTHDHPSPRTCGNDHLMQRLGKAKDACLRKKSRDFLIEYPVGWCGSTMLTQHCFRRPMIGWRKSGRKALGQPGT